MPNGPTTYRNTDGNPAEPPEGGWKPPTADTPHGELLVDLILKGEAPSVRGFNRICATCVLVV